MALEKTAIQTIAKLARLEFETDMQVELTHKLNQIMGMIDQLNQVDVTGIEPMSHPLEMQCVLRADEVDHQDLFDDIAQNAPDFEQRLFKVPKVIE